MLITRRRFKLSQTEVIPDDPNAEYIYVIAGGSNGVGYGLQSSLPYPYRTDDIVSREKIYVNNSGFQQLEIGVNNESSPNGSGFYSGKVGAEVVLMKRLAEEYPDNNVYLVKFCTDNTDMAYWLATGLDLLKAKVLAAKASLEGLGKTVIIKGILWVQGEADALAGRTKLQYRTDLDAVYSSLCTLHNNIQIGVYQIHSSLVGGGQGLTDVRQAQKEFCDAVPDKRFLINCDKNSLIDSSNLDTSGIVRLGLRAIMAIGNRNDPMTDVNARYKGVFKILGTPEQRAFTLEVLPQIKFPLEELTYGANASIGYASIIGSGSLGTTTGDGQVTIEQTLVGNQERGRECIIHEVGHAVDSGLPVTNEQQNAIKTLVGCPTCTWYPDGDEFRSQYEEILREAFPQYFITSYSDRFYTDGTHHPITTEQIPAFRAIMGYDRTDA